MHKDFYASGFLYHVPTQKILLQQTNKPDGIFLSLFGGKGRKGEDAPSVFQRIILEILELNIPLKSIHQIYDFPREYGDNHFIQYAEIDDPIFNKVLKQKDTAVWFELKKLSKIKLTDQIRQDIIVGQRVINAIERSRQPAIV